MKQVLVAYDSQPVDAAMNELEEKVLWEQLQFTSVREFIALERAAFRVWKQAGGSVPDATRVVDIQLRFSEKMNVAYKAFILSEDTHGRHDPQLKKQWSKFKVVFRRVGLYMSRLCSNCDGNFCYFIVSA